MLAWAGVTMAGCRDLDAPVPHNRNLGNEETLLLPTQGSRYDVDLKSGAADWYEFREFDTEEQPEAVAEAETADEDEGGLESTIRELISEYNELIAERNLEGLLEYHVEDQHEIIGALIEAGFAIVDKVAELRALLEEQLPEAQNRVTEVFGGLAEALDPELTVDTLTVVNDQEVIGKLRQVGGIPECRFVLVEGDWYIMVPQLPGFGGMKPALDTTKGAFETLIQGLRSGQVSAEETLSRLESMANMMGATPEGSD